MKLNILNAPTSEKTIEVPSVYFAAKTTEFDRKVWAFSEGKCIYIYLSVMDDNYASIETSSNNLRALPFDHVEINPMEFAAAYEKAQLAITESFLKACQPKVPHESALQFIDKSARALAGDGDE